MIKIVERELAMLSRHLIKRFRPFIIGITGSSGKTTTKYFIAELLEKTTHSVLVTPGNLNTKLGIPLSILGFVQAPTNWFGWLGVVLYAPVKALFTFKFEKFLVLEYGIDRPGDMLELIEIAKPDITVITNIGQAHVEIFGTQAEIAKEKWRLAQAASEAVIINKNTLVAVKSLEEVRVNFYILPSIKFAKAENIKALTNKTEFDLYIANKKYACQFKYFGQHNVENLELAAFTVHSASGDDEKIVRAIESLSPLKGRGKRFFGRDGILVLDESYNANPGSMKAALDTLGHINYGRKVAILGQMAEIGPISKQAHQEIADYAKKVSDFVVGVGSSFSDLGLDRWYQDVSELTSEANTFLEKEDVVLVKGSRSNELDKLVDYLEVK